MANQIGSPDGFIEIPTRRPDQTSERLRELRANGEALRRSNVAPLPSKLPARILTNAKKYFPRLQAAATAYLALIQKLESECDTATAPAILAKRRQAVIDDPEAKPESASMSENDVRRELELKAEALRAQFVKSAMPDYLAAARECFATLESSLEGEISGQIAADEKVAEEYGAPLGTPSMTVLMIQNLRSLVRNGLDEVNALSEQIKLDPSVQGLNWQIKFIPDLTLLRTLSVIGK